MKPFIELSVLEQKARKKSENIKCGDCPFIGYAGKMK